jgi:hypothetical protein
MLNYQGFLERTPALNIDLMPAESHTYNRNDFILRGDGRSLHCVLQCFISREWQYTISSCKFDVCHAVDPS